MWILCGVLSVAFCILSWYLASNKNMKAVWASGCSLSFVVLELLMEYKLIFDWVNTKDWSALLDVVPSMYSMLTGYVIIMLFANALVMTQLYKK